MPLTNPPFMHQKGQPPMYARDLEPEEMAQWRRLRDQAEKNCSASSRCDSVESPSGINANPNSNP